MFRAVLTSDWHLLGMNNVLPDAAKKQFTEINKGYLYAAENGINSVIVPGDISDVPRLDEDNMMRLVTHLLYWDESITTYYILGNHDVHHKYRTSLDLLRVLCDAGVFKRFHLFYAPEERKIGGVHCSFLPFPYLKLAKSDHDDPRLIFAHLETEGAIGDNGRPMKHGDEEKVRRRPQDFIVSGHIHKHQYLKKKRLMYVGTPYQKNFGEMGVKGFVDLQARYKEDKLVVKFEQIDSRPNFHLQVVEVNDQADWGKLKRDENIRYKILVNRDAGVTVPKNITHEFPNIVMLGGIRSQKVDKDAPDESERSTDTVPTFNPRRGLRRYLLKRGLDKSLIKRAKKEVDEAIRYTRSLKRT